MLTVQALESTFAAYLRELRRVRDNRAYWSALHLLLTVPEICGALQSVEGRSSHAAYRAWAHHNLAVSFLSPSDWYHAHCQLLHHGRTPAATGHAGAAGARYDRFVYVDPESAPGQHGRIAMRRGHLEIVLDVAELCDAMHDGLYRWFRSLVQGPSRDASARVQRHLSTLPSPLAGTPVG